MSDRKIKFLSRNLPFPTDPTFREYRVIQEITGVTAQQIMTGEAGIWMLPALAIVALLRADANTTIETLDRILDLDPSMITLEGDFENPQGTTETTTVESPTGTLSTDEIREENGIPALPTSSPEPPENPMT